MNFDYVVQYVNEILETSYFKHMKTETHAVAVQCRQGIENELYDSVNPLPSNVKQEQINQTVKFFKGTPIEDFNEYMIEIYGACRGRLVSMAPKSLLEYHVDESPRIHLPIIVPHGSFMIVDDKLVKFKVGELQHVDTTKYHTALNASNSIRVHMVYCIPNERA